MKLIGNGHRVVGRFSPRAARVYVSGGGHRSGKRRKMAIVKWIELKCDQCGDIYGGLRFQDDINTRALREESRQGGWVGQFRDGALIDLCPVCHSAHRPAALHPLW